MTVHDDILSNRLILRLISAAALRATVEGDIAAKSVRIETGGVFRGTSRMGGRSDSEDLGAIPVSANLSSVA